MGKNGDVMEGMSREDLKRLLRIARDQPIPVALALDKSGAALLLLDKRKLDTALDRQMHAPTLPLHRHGTVMIDPDDAKLAVFTGNKTAPGMAQATITHLYFRAGTGANPSNS